MTSFERSPWWAIGIFLIGNWIMLLWEQVPVLIRRGEYRRLKDNDYLIGDAHRALNENHRLRVALAKSEPRLEDCDLSHL